MCLHLIMRRRPLSLRAPLLAGCVLLAVAQSSSGSVVTPGLGTLTQFTGGDPGDGLDLSGNFAYALDGGNTSSGNLVVDGATFIPASGATPPSGMTGVANDFRYSAIGAFNVEYGSTTNDNNLEQITDSVWYGEDFTLNLSVTPGQAYKLQFIFQEAYTGLQNSPHRVFDVLHETPASPTTPVLAVDNLSQGTETTPNQGLVYTYSFTAADDTFTFRLVDDPSGADGNAILGALTLEIVPEPTGFGLLMGAALAFLARRRR